VRIALIFMLLAAAKRAPLPECSHDSRNVRRVIVVHLGGCAKPTETVEGLTGGLGLAGEGWSLALATDKGIRNLRKRGCPTAMVCTSGNELAVLQQSLTVEEMARRLEEVKALASPPLRTGTPPGPIVPWE
jgi:hypothetical protein